MFFSGSANSCFIRLKFNLVHVDLQPLSYSISGCLVESGRNLKVPCHTMLPRLDLIIYCKRTNIRGSFYFAMFAVGDFSAKLKPPLLFYNTSVYSYVLITLVSKFEICEIKTPAKGFHQENREILKPRN